MPLQAPAPPPRQPWQLLLLGAILVLPVVAFLLLKTFGYNAWKLRTYLPERIVARQEGAQFFADTIFHRVNDSMALTASSGHAFDPVQQLAGRKLVLALLPGAASDPQVRALLSGLKRVQARYQHLPEVKLLVVVPADSAQTLAAVAERVGAVSGKWVFAAAAPATIAALRTELRDSLATSTAAQRLWLLDADRYLRGIYDGADPRDVERLLTEIDVLYKIERNPKRP